MGPRVAEPFTSGAATFMHGLTFSGHPLSTAIGLAALDVYERDGVLANVNALEPGLRSGLDELRRSPLVGDVRGAGFFWAIELVRDSETKQTFEPAEADWLLREVLSARFHELGLLCRLDDRGDPVIQLSPPLVADEALLGRIVDIVGSALEEAWTAWTARTHVGSS
jgi:adenosylmethionine-8-amino-7-oxononanoate aminotransferase